MSLYTRDQLRELAGLSRSAVDFRKSEANRWASGILAEETKEAARKSSRYHFFLSHSSLDAAEVLALKRDIEGMGYTVYVDWIDDAALDRARVTPATAAIIRERIKQCRALLYATSPQAATSKWMPWELGFGDAEHGRVAIVPIVDDYSVTFQGQEYLGLYPYVTKGNLKNTTTPALWVNDSLYSYVYLTEWLEGVNPSERS